MSQQQYLKNIQKEISRINRLIDAKILRGEEYKKEAHEHKLLLKKIRFIERQNFFRRLREEFSSRARFASFF
jgi:hypothetical protein